MDIKYTVASTLNDEDDGDTAEDALLRLREAIQDCEKFGRVFCRRELHEPFQVTGAILDSSGNIVIVQE